MSRKVLSPTAKGIGGGTKLFWETIGTGLWRFLRITPAIGDWVIGDFSPVNRKFASVQ